MPLEGNFNVGIPAYVGPADVVASPTYWCGLRAMSAAIAAAGTQTLVNLRRDSDNGTVDVLVASNGGFGLTANGSIGGTSGITVSTFKGSANLFVTKVYDQSGSGNDFAQLTAARQPGLNLAGIGSLSVITFVKASSQWLSSSFSTGVFPQPFTVSAVANYTNNSSQSPLFSSEDDFVQMGFDLSGSTANAVYLYGGTLATNNATATDGNWHALNGVYNGSSSIANVDGTDTTGLSIGTHGFNNVGLNWGTDDRSTDFFNGSGTEVGLWVTTSFTGTQRNNMASNQRGYWGF